MDQILAGGLGKTRPETKACTTPAPTYIPYLEGFLARYLTGQAILDLRAASSQIQACPIVPGANLLPWTEEDGVSSLPCLPESQDAVFAHHATSSAAGDHQLLREVFRVLKPGGHLVMIVSPRISAADPAAAFSGAATIGALESALQHDRFRVVHFDIARRDAGRKNVPSNTGDEIRLVVEKPAIRDRTHLRIPAPTKIGTRSVAVLPFDRTKRSIDVALGMRHEDGLLVRDFGPPVRQVRRILVLKLDHLGDFIIGLPALRKLRHAFPKAHIRLVCGRWNATDAWASNLVDDVRTYDYFPERARGWDGKPVQGWDVFEAATEGEFDLAVDLRVDDDTRHLLGQVNATLRCGIGSQSRFPMLDVALPTEHQQRDIVVPAMLCQHLDVSRFNSEMPTKTPFFHEVSFGLPERTLIHGPYLDFPIGRFRACFGVSVPGFIPGPFGSGITIQIVKDGGLDVASKSFGRRSLGSLTQERTTLDFENYSERSRYEFRVRVSGRPLSGKIRFSGVQVQNIGTLSAARFRPAELHVGEQLSLLVDLIEQRAADNYPQAGWPNRGIHPTAGGKDGKKPAGKIRILIAPLSNATLRDWPTENYDQLIGLLLDQLDCSVMVIGSASQLNGTRQFFRHHRDEGRLIDLVGQTRWSELPGLLQSIDLVICNNSGVAHLAASLGVRTLALYSGSHQPAEWGPRGKRARALMASVACSPCGFEQVEECPNGHACMRLIEPELVLDHARQLLGIDVDREPGCRA
jgi:ADP-heptose:LPS heptosyltransferase/SAM-dependent methyltransferase